jgi:hypothetical protein
MTAYRKASIRDLTQAAYALNGHFIQGVLRYDKELQKWMVDDKPLDTWLARQENTDVTLIIVATEHEKPMESKVCRICGREYVGIECPVCRETRIRLRGR